MSDEKGTNQPGDERIIELYKEILSFRKHNDTILMAEASVLAALTSGLIYVYGQVPDIRTIIAFMGIISSGCFLLLMWLMVLGAEARDNLARKIEKNLGLRHMNYVKCYMDFCQWRVRAKYIILVYGILLIIFWLYLFSISYVV